MRHRRANKHFNRDTNHRKMLVRNLVRALVEQGEITTTEAKAKAVKQWADRLISTAQGDELHARRLLHRFFGKRDVVNTLVERIAPAMSKRKSGFSRIVRLGKRRGDNVEMVKLSLVEQPKETGTLKSGKTYKKPAKKAVKKAAPKKAASKPKAKPAKKAAAKSTKKNTKKSTKKAKSK